MTQKSSISPPTLEGWPPLYLTPVPHDDIRRGDGPAVVKRIEALCTISKDTIAGRAGEPVVLRKWQKQLIYRMFARLPNGRRRFRFLMIGMPVKNGKSALASGFALDGLLFDVAGAEVYSAAAEKEQARIVYSETKRIIEANEELSELCRPMRDVIEVPSTNSIYRVLSAEAYSKEGINSSRNIIDELHAHQNRELFDVLINRTGARLEPMTIVITTAGVMYDAHGDDSVCFQQYKHGIDVAKGLVEDPSFFFAWWGAPEGADHTDENVWRAANPGYDDIVSAEDVAEKLLRLPENEFRTKRLNQWVAAEQAWLPAGAWNELEDRNRTIPDRSQVVLGFDGSFSGDATALVVVSCDAKPHIDVVKIWERQETDPPDWRVPRGDVKQVIRAACKRWRVVEISADQFIWVEDLEDLAAEGLPVVTFPQVGQQMIAATQRFYEQVMSKDLTHSGDPVLARHIANAVIKRDSRGARLVKDSKNSSRHIDAAIAAVMARDRAAVLGPIPTPKYYSMANLPGRA